MKFTAEQLSPEQMSWNQLVLLGKEFLNRRRYRNAYYISSIKGFNVNENITTASHDDFH